VKSDINLESCSTSELCAAVHQYGRNRTPEALVDDAYYRQLLQLVAHRKQAEVK
jgi:hypothetical protein